MAKKELEILLKATKVSKSFGDFVANQNIDISIAKGQIHALLGENGAGKSTLVKIFYGQTMEYYLLDFVIPKIRLKI